MPISGTVCHPWAGTYYDQPAYQIFEVSIFIHYEDIAEKNVKFGVVWVVRHPP